jgi:hypothetical protein
MPEKQQADDKGSQQQRLDDHDSTVTHTDMAPSWMRPMPIAVEIKIGTSMVTPW